MKIYIVVKDMYSNILDTDIDYYNREYDSVSLHMHKILENIVKIFFNIEDCQNFINQEGNKFSYHEIELGGRLHLPNNIVQTIDLDLID